MYKKRIIGEGTVVETHGRASSSPSLTKTHGRAFLLVGLVLLFGACEKDIVGGIGDGKKVEIFFSTNITSYHRGADIVRSGDVREPESRTIYINDSIYLQTTLVPDAEEELRAAAFKEGQKLCFAAFKADGSEQVGATAVYTYSGGKWTSSNPLGVVPDNSTVYRFVAYSYFDETGTPPTDGSSIDPVHDLVWGQSVNTKIEDETEVKRTVSINMTHKFARVKVVVKSGITGANITALSGVSIDGGQLAELTPFDGDISWSGTATQGVADPFDVVSGTERASGYRTVTPVAAGSLKVKVGSVQVSAVATTFSNQTVSFTPALDASTSYTLVVNLKKCVWSRSKSYWDGSKLTVVTDPNDLSKQGYQGVYFKWGSVVGVSPIGSWVDNSTPVYKAGSSSSSTYSSWASIPYVDNGTAMGTPDVSTLKGDICRYINSGYRVPTAGEFGVGSGWNEQGWERGSFSTVTSNKADGTYDLANGNRCAKNTMMGDVLFPASWVRGASNGYSSSTAGNIGFYWISPAPDTTSPYLFSFSTDRIYISTNAVGGVTYTRQYYATAVRCVKN
jgi:hypothetical protein